MSYIILHSDACSSFNSLCLLSTSRFKSLECRSFLCCPNPPMLFNYFAVSRGTLLKRIPAPPVLWKESIMLDIESFWKLGLNGCTEYMPVFKIWHQVQAVNAWKWGLKSRPGVDKNHRTEWLFLFINASLLGWKIIFSPVLSLVHRLKQTPQSFQAPTRMWQERKICFGDILHPVKNGPRLCLQPSSFTSFPLPVMPLYQLGFQL